MKDSLTNQEASILFLLIEMNDLSFPEFVQWGYTQFDEDGAPPWIEEAVVAVDLNEVKGLLAENFKIEDLRDNLAAGVVAHEFSTGRISAMEAVGKLYGIHRSTKGLSKEDELSIYKMDNFYDYHDNPSAVVLPLLTPLLAKYKPFYDIESKFKNKT